MFLYHVLLKNCFCCSLQVIYATTPIFATGLAFLFLHSSDEAMGPLAWFGAALMLSASVIASVGVTQHEAV